MRGHHIYTRSWFEYGSRRKNPGSFTIELTNGLFRDNQQEAIYRILTPKAAAVPEGLITCDSNDSVLLLYHPYPNTTVICRKWLVTDVITRRGTVVYAYSQVFSDDDTSHANEALLKAPAEGFAAEYFESYESFAARVNASPNEPISPIEIVQQLPIREPGSRVYGREYWMELFAGSEEEAKNYLSSICKAILSKYNAKVGVKLAEEMNAEELIIATMEALPVWLQRRFGAVSKWKGFMDGNTSASIDGMQLVCYQEWEPASRSRYPVFDFTNQGKGINVETPQDPELEDGLVDWIWQTLDSPEHRDSFETFMETEFGAICDELSFEEQAVCYYFSNAFQKNPFDELHSEKRFVTVPNFKPKTAKGMLYLIHSYFASDFQNLSILQRLARKCCDILLSTNMIDLSAEEPTQSANTTDALLWLMDTTDQESALKAKEVLSVLWNTYKENGKYDLLENVANTFLDKLEDLISADAVGTVDIDVKAPKLTETIREVLHLLPGDKVSHDMIDRLCNLAGRRDDQEENIDPFYSWRNKFWDIMKDWLSEATESHAWETARKILEHTPQIIEEVPESRNSMEWFQQPISQMEADKLTKRLVEIICQMSGLMGESWSDFEKEICGRLIEKNQWDHVEIFLRHEKDKIDSAVLAEDEEKQLAAIIEGKVIAELCLEYYDNAEGSKKVESMENTDSAKNECKKLSYQILNHDLKYIRKQIFEAMCSGSSYDEIVDTVKIYTSSLHIQRKYNAEELNMDFFTKCENIPNSISVMNVQKAALILFNLEVRDIKLGGLIPEVTHWEWVYPILSKYLEESKQKEIFKLFWQTKLTFEEKKVYLAELEGSNKQYVSSLLSCDESVKKEIQEIYEQRYIDEIKKISTLDDKAWEQIAYISEKAKKIGLMEEFHTKIKTEILNRCIQEVMGNKALESNIWTENITWETTDYIEKKLRYLNLHQGFDVLLRKLIHLELNDVLEIANKMKPKNVKNLEKMILNHEMDTQRKITESQLFDLSNLSIPYAIKLIRELDVIILEDNSELVESMKNSPDMQGWKKISRGKRIVSFASNWKENNGTNQITIESLCKARIFYSIKCLSDKEKKFNHLYIAYTIAYYCTEGKLSYKLLRILSLLDETNKNLKRGQYEKQNTNIGINVFLRSIKILLSEQKEDAWKDIHIEPLVLEIYRMLLEVINNMNFDYMKNQLYNDSTIEDNCRIILDFIEKRGVDEQNELRPGIIEIIKLLDLKQSIIGETEDDEDDEDHKDDEIGPLFKQKNKLRKSQINRVEKIGGVFFPVISIPGILFLWIGGGVKGMIAVLGYPAATAIFYIASIAMLGSQIVKPLIKKKFCSKMGLQNYSDHSKIE